MRACARAPAREPGTRQINVTYVIDQGPRIYIERINIIGNLRTHDYVIRREFRLAEGDAYNPLMVDKAKKRLQNLGFFKTVEIKRRPGSAQDRVVLDVELVEQSTGELSFGAGYSTSEGVIGDVSITERNLLGKGQFLRLRLAGSAERLQVDLSFTEPRFLDRNLAAGFDVFHKDVNMSQVSAFRSMTTGGSLRLAFPLSENLWLTNSYTLSRGEIYDVDHLIASKAIQEAEGVAWTSAWGTSLAYDTRNHPKTPTSGYFFQVGTDVAGLGGDVQYVRVAGEARYYYPITEKITFVGRAIGGHIMGWGGDDVRLHRPLLQGRRDGARLQPWWFRPARPQHQRRARRLHLLGNHGRGALPAALHPRGSGHGRRLFRGCRLAVRGGGVREEPGQDCVPGTGTPLSVWPTTPPFAPRPAAASSGTRRWDRCGSISPRHSSRRAMTKSS